MHVNRNLQGLRGILALIVFLGHASGTFNSTIRDRFLTSPFGIFIDGSISVIVFFVLSGFFYYKVNPQISSRIFCLRTFKRLVKLLPTYWIILVVGAIACNIYIRNGYFPVASTSTWFSNHWKETVDMNRFIHEFLIINRGYDTTHYVNPPSWYLEADIKMMVVFPLLLGLLKKKWSASWLILFFIAIIKFSFKENFITSTCSLIGLFLIGAMTCRYVNTFKALCRNRQMLIAILICSVMALDIRYVLCYEYLNGSVKNIIPLIQAIGGGMLIGILISMRDVKYLSHSALVKLGNLSYEFYICHFVVIMLIRPFVTIPVGFYISSFLVSLLVSSVLYYMRIRIYNICFKFVEERI